MRRYVYINNHKERIWTLSANTESNNTPIVLIHGFCGAIGLWAHNISELCKSRPLYAIDVLGFGRSSRPMFSNDPIEAENQFVESIDSWRKSLGINEMILLGHSFGGFLSSSYALKYPQHTKALILADSWGFPERTSNVQYPLMIKLAMKMARHFSPFSFIRGTGPLGLLLFKKFRPDFRLKYIDLFGNNDLIYDYIYHSNRQMPRYCHFKILLKMLFFSTFICFFSLSGEYGFRAISDRGHAKYPMINRISKLTPNISIWFIYGNKSWITKETGDIVKGMCSGFVSVKVYLRF